MKIIILSADLFFVIKGIMIFRFNQPVGSSADVSERPITVCNQLMAVLQYPSHTALAAA